MEWWLLRRRLRFRLNRTQKKALSGEIPMTKELFWSCVDILFQRHEREKFWEVWEQYPEYVRQWYDAYEKRMADPHSPQRREADARWADMKNKLIRAFGEDWVNKNLR